MQRLTSLLALGVAALAVHAHAAKPDPLTATRKIDALLAKDWAANHVAINPPANDQTMVRRLYLDIVGRIPTAREAEDFLQSKDPKKRQKLIDQLLSGEGYVQNYFNFWADVLRAQTRPQNGGAAGGITYTKFIKDSLRSNKPYDQFVKEMVSATGKVWENGAIGYYMRDRGMPLDNMATTVRIFLGTRIECAQCHNHPFDHWTQKQFYQMAAFTYGVNSYDDDGGTMGGVRQILSEREQQLRKRMKGNTDPAVKEEYDKFMKDGKYRNQALGQARNPLQAISVSYRERKLQLPHDYKYPDDKPNALVGPAVMMGKAIDCPPGAGSKTLDEYAAWMTSSENPRFTRVVVNRLWKKAFGLALIEPLDELMDDTVSMEPELQTYLESFMVASGYDMKAYLKAIFNSKAYQAQVTREEVPAGVAYHFNGPLLRRMTAEQMWDSFVALINPTPDMANTTAIEQDEKKVLGIKKLNDALNSLTPEEMIKGADEAGAKYREQSERIKELQGQFTQARQDGDKEKTKELGRQLNDLQNLANRAVIENITAPGVFKLAASTREKAQTGDKTLLAGGPAASGATPDSGMMMMMGGGNDIATLMNKVQIPGYDIIKSDQEVQAEHDQQQKTFTEEATYYGIPDKQLKSYVQYRQQQGRNWLRAAEVESPAPRGHYLREFGQSDRETVENANRDASVPQALAMMNGNLLPEIVGNYSQLMLSVNRAKYPDDQVAAIYMTLLSRPPTAKEKAAWLDAQNKGMTDAKDLIYALLNTQQFIFIQ